MNFTVSCPHCSGPITASPDAAGRVVGCPHCRQALALPTAPCPPQAAPPAHSPFAIDTVPARQEDEAPRTRRPRQSSNIALILVVVGGIAVAGLGAGAIIYFSLPDQVGMRRLYVDYMSEKQYIESMEKIDSGELLGGEVPHQPDPQRTDDIKNAKKYLAELNALSKKRYGCPARELGNRLNDEQWRIAQEILYPEQAPTRR
jgi:hypothetical protein